MFAPHIYTGKQFRIERLDFRLIFERGLKFKVERAKNKTTIA